MDVNVRDDEGMTPLHYAALHGNGGFAAELVRAGADADAQCGGGWRPLHFAAKAGNGEIAALLIKAGANVNAAKADGCTPLHLSALNGHCEIAAGLVKAGCNVNAKTESGLRSLHFAARDGYLEITALLIKAGADVNAAEKDGPAPLHVAAGRGHSAVAEALVKAGANVNAKDEDGETPLDLAEHGARRAQKDIPKAAEYGRIVDMLREAGGANGEKRGGESGDGENAGGENKLPSFVDDLDGHFLEKMKSFPLRLAEGLKSDDSEEFGKSVRGLAAHIAKLAVEQARDEFLAVDVALMKKTLQMADEQTETIVRNREWLAAARVDFDETFPDLQHEEIRRQLPDLAREVMRKMGATQWDETVRDAVGRLARKRYAYLLQESGEGGGGAGGLH